MTMYLGVGYQINGRTKSGRRTVIKKSFLDVCFAGMSMGMYDMEGKTPESLTYYPIPNREVIKTPGEIKHFLNVLNKVFTKTPPVNIENYMKGITVSAELPYEYILAYFSSIRMLDENPHAASTIARLASVGIGRHDPHALFLIGSCIKDYGYIEAGDKYGHSFPDWMYWNKDALSLFRGFEDRLLKEPPYKVRPRREREMEETMFGRNKPWGYGEMWEFITKLPSLEARSNYYRVEEWLTSR